MPLYINAVCDHCNHTAQGATFTSTEETLLELLDAYRHAGWKVKNKFDPKKDLDFTCPKCVDKD